MNSSIRLVQYLFIHFVYFCTWILHYLCELFICSFISIFIYSFCLLLYLHCLQSIWNSIIYTAKLCAKLQSCAFNPYLFILYIFIIVVLQTHHWWIKKHLKNVFSVFLCYYFLNDVTFSKDLHFLWHRSHKRKWW